MLWNLNLLVICYDLAQRVTVLRCWRHAGLAPDRCGSAEDKATRHKYLPRRAGPRIVVPEPQAVQFPEGGLSAEEEDIQSPSLKDCLLKVTKVMGLTPSL